MSAAEDGGAGDNTLGNRNVSNGRNRIEGANHHSEVATPHGAVNVAAIGEVFAVSSGDKLKRAQSHLGERGSIN